MDSARDCAEGDTGQHVASFAATSDHGAVVEQARELVRFARKHGYRRDELIRIIESVD